MITIHRCVTEQSKSRWGKETKSEEDYFFWKYASSFVTVLGVVPSYLEAAGSSRLVDRSPNITGINIIFPETHIYFTYTLFLIQFEFLLRILASACVRVCPYDKGHIDKQPISRCLISLLVITYIVGSVQLDQLKQGMGAN